jgi:hypothetical protein
MANAGGIRNATTVSNLEDFRRNLRALLDETELSVLVTKIETGTIKFLTAEWMENGTNTFLPVTSKKQKKNRSFGFGRSPRL